MPVEIADVRRALENEEMVPCFQPMVELRTGRLAGFEVLARWQAPGKIPQLPPNFISLADENGLITVLMRQIVRKALRAASALPDSLVFAVNVSPTQLHDRKLPSLILELATEAGFPLARLTIEVTESALCEDLELAQIIAGELKAMGCQLALDDFGTGYSSLLHLQALPFAQLKIDRSFVSSMTSKRESRKIVAAIIGLGHSLGLATVAEGVETEEQAEMLLWLGCELGQGWLYGHPVLAEDLPALIAARIHGGPVMRSAPGDGWAVSSLEALPTQRLAQLQAIYDGAPVGLCFLDCNLRYINLNHRLASMNGAPVAAHLGRTVHEMLPELFPAVEPYLLRALKGEAMADVEVLRPSDITGEPPKTLLLSYQPAWDEADEVIGISVAVVDITQRKQTEESPGIPADLKPQQDELENQTRSITDAKGHIIQMSSQWVPTSELSRKEMRNLGWLEALHPDDVEPTMKTMREALQNGEPIDIKYRVRDVDGDWRWMRSRGSPRFAASGEIMRWRGTVEDVAGEE
jgi:PAS domain S-box-containing protein